MRFIATALIATLGLGACTEPARRALGPIGDSNRRDAIPVAADTIIDAEARPGAAPSLVSGAPLRLPKARGPHRGPGVVVMSFVIDTSGLVIRNSVRIDTALDREFGDAFRDWLCGARFEPVRAGSQPVRAAFRNLTAVFHLTG